jgi:Adenine deaminase C-terminal domain
VVVELAALREAGRTIQSSLQHPTMMLAFLPLCVVPALKLTDFGLVRYNPSEDQAPTLLADQRGLRRPALRANGC